MSGNNPKRSKKLPASCVENNTTRCRNKGLELSMKSNGSDGDPNHNPNQYGSMKRGCPSH